MTDVQSVIRIVNAGLKVLTHRVVTLLVLLLTFALYAWCLLDPNWPRIVAASLFALFGLAIGRPIEERKQHEQDEIPH